MNCMFLKSIFSIVLLMYLSKEFSVVLYLRIGIRLFLLVAIISLQELINLEGRSLMNKMSSIKRHLIYEVDL